MSRTGPILVVLVVATLAVSVLHTFDGVPPAAGSDAARLAAIEARLERIEALVREGRDDARRAVRAGGDARRVGLSSAAPGRDGASGASAVASGGPASAGGGVFDAQALETAVAERLEKVLARRDAEQAHRSEDGQWKPPMDSLTLSLELNEEQESVLHDVFDRARDEALALLKTRRNDGGSLLDDFVDALAEGKDLGAAEGALFVQLASSKAPGRNQTYLAILAESGKRIGDDVASRLTPAQAARFREMNVDVFDVKTGYDPLGDYVRQRLEDAAD